MTVTLELETTFHDITGLLDDEADIGLGQEHELKMFQRTVDDIRLRCSNMHGEFTTWLGSPSSVAPRIRIDDGGRILFRGEIQQPLSFDINGEWVSFDCFSMTKTFWDRCKQTRVSKATPVGQEDLLFTTVKAVLERELTPERFGDLFKGLQIADIYAARQIRFWGYTADQTIGNNGRYRDLDPRLTIDELFKAMTIYYNADIFIDPATQLLVMQKRDEILNDTNHQLDDQVEEDEEFAVEIYDEKVDYIGLALNFAKPTAPVPQATAAASGDSGLYPGRYIWAVTYLYQSGSFSLESALGDQSSSIDLLVNRTGARSNVTLQIPTGPGGCIARRIYRTKNGGIGNLYLVGQVDNNSDTTFYDTLPHDKQSALAPKGNAGGTIWIRFDEETGTWDAAIVGDEAGLNTPFGEIFDVTPGLRFLSKLFGYGIEIAHVYPLNGETRIRTKGEHGFEKLMGVKINHTTCTPALDGNYTVREVFEDKVTFSIEGPAVTAPGFGGTVVRESDLDKDEPLDVASETLLDVFAFFGNEKDKLTELQDQWINLFRSRKRVKMTAKDLAYRIGDSASLNQIYNGHRIGKCVIKKATNHLMKETTKLELLTI